MNYKQVIYSTTSDDIRAMLIADLSELSFEGFEETTDGLNAFIDEEHYNDNAVKEIGLKYDLPYNVATIAQQNWNAAWESNFQPVVIEHFCTVRAHFHDMQIATPYEIVITPKMSFGTGHHATTQLMLQMMRSMSLQDKKVLDFGTGTGILAIMAEKLGAKSIIAIDNDEWSYENAVENIVQNSAHSISVEKGSLEIVTGEKFDIILANINRHILLQYMDSLADIVESGGTVLMSGLLKNDKEIIYNAASRVGLLLVAEDEMNNWITLQFSKS